MDVLAVARSLSDCLPVDELTDEQLSELLLHAQVRRFDRDEVVYHRGDPSKHIHVVVLGSVKLVRDDAQGREVLLWVVERGALFGQQGVFGTVRPATAIAITSTETLQLVGDVVRRVLERNPRIMFRAFQMIEARLEKLTQALEDVMLLDVPSRVAKYLLDSGDGSARAPSPALTQDELAAAVGSTRVTVNKILADFEHRGLIKVSRRHVDVIARDALRKEIQV